MGKDWTGDGNSIYKTLGASNHTEDERETNDYYATDPNALKALLDKEEFNTYIWENAVGEGHLAKVLEDRGFDVRASDIIDRGYPNTEIIDFLKYEKANDRDIITNPPYKYALEFAQKSIEISKPGTKVAMFLKIQFLEGQKRREFFNKYPPARVYVFSQRVKCAKNGDFASTGSSAVAYTWFVWEVGQYTDPVIKWI